MTICYVMLLKFQYIHVSETLITSDAGTHINLTASFKFTWTAVLRVHRATGVWNARNHISLLSYALPNLLFEFHVLTLGHRAPWVFSVGLSGAASAPTLEPSSTPSTARYAV